MSHVVNVLIVEDDPSQRDQMAREIAQAEDMRLTSAVDSLQAGLAALDNGIDLVLVDLHLGAESGVDLIRAAQAFPKIRTLVVTMFGDEATTISALEAGADGYVLKGDPHIRLTTSIRAVLNGEAPISPAIARHLLRRFQSAAPAPPDQSTSLTPREQEVLEALAIGLSYKEAAREIGISPHTVNFHIRSLYKKLSATSRAEAVRAALKNGMIVIDDDR